MKIIKSIDELRSVLHSCRNDGKSIGFVPTMGCLHAGHLGLVGAARASNDVVVVSIFVNPIQFGPTEDYASYPRDLDRDATLLEAAEVDFLFAPPVGEMYPVPMRTSVDVPSIGRMLEGAVRPDYFRGVATVVTKLFNIVQPHRAYFGEKDYQQVLVIQQLARDLAFPVEIIRVATVRDADGLALSSRNVYLSPEERRAALVLSRALGLADNELRAGKASVKQIEERLRTFISEEPLAHIDVVAIRDADTLEELADLGPRNALILLFVRFGKAQLLDQAVVGIA